MENDEIKLNYSRERLTEIKEDCKEEISKINSEYGDGRIAIEDEIENVSRQLQNQLEIWLVHNLDFISNHIKCIVPLRTDEVVRGIINSIVNRYKKLRKKYTQLKSAHGLKSKDLPFNAANIVYSRQVILPLVAETEILKVEILLITKKIYKN